MRQTGVRDFKEGVNGLVGRHESISFNLCNIGDGLLTYHFHVCCPCKQYSKYHSDNTKCILKPLFQHLISISDNIKFNISIFLACYSNPCMNGGWCQQNSDWDYVCQCRFGYEGKNCENSMLCFKIIQL